MAARPKPRRSPAAPASQFNLGLALSGRIPTNAAVPRAGPASRDGLPAGYNLVTPNTSQLWTEIPARRATFRKRTTSGPARWPGRCPRVKSGEAVATDGAEVQ